MTRTYEWLRSKKPDAAIWMTCCGAPAEWAGEVDIHAAHLEEMRRQWRELGEPTVVLACPNCRKMFEEYLPELPVVFLAEVMEEWGVEKDAALEPDNAEKGEMEAGSAQQAQSYALFDPCASRYYPELQESVRHLADAAGITWENLPYDGKRRAVRIRRTYRDCVLPSHDKRI